MNASPSSPAFDRAAFLRAKISRLPAEKQAKWAVRPVNALDETARYLVEQDWIAEAQQEADLFGG
jgi:hypothetical protein